MAKRSKAGDSKVGVAYLRCSTTEERQALGIEAQRHAIEAYAAREGIVIAAWYTEEVSGGAALDKRPVLLEALAATKEHGAGALLVHRLDRFSRDPLTAALAQAELQRNGAMLLCADGAGSGDDPTSELVRGILLSVARFEKAMIGARIKAALAVKQRRGERTGAAPYGQSSVGGVLVPDTHEQSVIEQARALRAEGRSFREITAALESRGIVGRTGRPLARQQVHRMLTRAA